MEYEVREVEEFRIDADGIKDDLNKCNISERLGKAFKTKGHSLSENDGIRDQKSSNWEITDGGMIYIVKEEDGKLNICGKTTFKERVKVHQLSHWVWGIICYCQIATSPPPSSSLSFPHPIHPAPQNLFPNPSLVDSLSCSI